MVVSTLVFPSVHVSVKLATKVRHVNSDSDRDITMDQVN